ncbi:inositol 1,4,5-trisphosphate receptor-interacting protein-like 2 [Coregonus clupeaformis]|uniref:inositol 1,4,5-trisphosphate receptor-interacting protein-like 2 n=1 Tax=Coregonus clupeaformis TaxID=59861 RepID=UPI001E1C8FAD|nr:inositol 1,4,5-trisphosphate receptor-interacting protein-like 2 [Coregonus clupeaformis]
MSVYTLNLRVFWPLLTCVLTGLVLHHHITHWLSSESGPESGPDPGYEVGTEPCSDQGPPVLLSLIKLLLACILCYLFIRYCSTHPGGAQRVPLEAADGALKSGRREVLEDYYERWVRLSPHVLGHSKAHVAKLVGELVRAGRATGGIPESSLAFRGDFLQVGSSYEEHKVGAPDYYDILVPLKVPRELRLEPRVHRGERRENGRKSEKGNRMRVRSSKVKDVPKDDSKVEEKMEVNEEGKEDLKEEVKEEMKGECSEDGGWSGVPRCSLEMPRRSDWVRKHRNFTDTFLRLHPSQGTPERSLRSSSGVTAGSGGGGGGGVYRLTPDSVLRWFYPAVQRCLATVRYPFEQRCTLSLTLADDRVQLRLTPRSDYVCCHISMAIRLLPAIPLGDGVYLVPMETTASVEMTNTDQHQDPQNQEKDLWTIFFPRQEQRLLGWLRGRSPQPSCHLKVLQLTKALRDLGGQALDSNQGALWRSVLSSYTLKTAWLRLLLSSPAEAWEERHLVARMEELVRSLRESLQNRVLDHLFLGSDSGSILPDSVALPKLVKEAVGAPLGGPVEGSGRRLGGSAGNLWAGVDPASLDLVSGRLAYAWSHLHRLIRLGRPQRSSLGLGRAANVNCLHLQPGE